jgi:hypothetical protein
MNAASEQPDVSFYDIVRTKNAFDQLESCARLLVRDFDHHIQRAPRGLVEKWRWQLRVADDAVTQIKRDLRRHTLKEQRRTR